MSAASFCRGLFHCLQAAPLPGNMHDTPVSSDSIGRDFNFTYFKQALPDIAFEDLFDL
jgi:hypothetical protein